MRRFLRSKESSRIRFPSLKVNLVGEQRLSRCLSLEGLLPSDRWFDTHLDRAGWNFPPALLAQFLITKVFHSEGYAKGDRKSRLILLEEAVEAFRGRLSSDMLESLENIFLHKQDTLNDILSEERLLKRIGDD